MPVAPIHRQLAGICLAVFAGSSFAQACSEPAVAVMVQEFYGAKHFPTSVPSLRELRKASTPFSRRLKGMLAKAATLRSKFEERFPSDKPPFVNGDIYRGPMDSARGFRVVSIRRTSEEGWRVLVQSTEEPGNSSWRVAVAVVGEAGRCVIDDVIYESGMSLTKSLRDESKDASETLMKPALKSPAPPVPFIASDPGRLRRPVG